MAYDIIGDIHGQADKLHALLAHMGYRVKDGAFRHPDRTAIFVGDFIDRGNKQYESVMTVRRMVEEGSAQAIMGNHEFNAIAWHTMDPANPDHFLRPHHGKVGEKNRRQHAAFLAEVESNVARHKEVIAWFLTLPLWLDLPQVRVVHACWHDGYMNELRPYLSPGLQLTPELMVSASQPDSMEYRTVEGLTKGLEIDLPEGHSFLDKDENVRKNVRVRWWDEDADNYGDLALAPATLREQLRTVPIAKDVRTTYDNMKPVFFGHYWMTGQPTAQTHTIACVDYSAGNGGPLVAYRWDGEDQLDNKHFESVA